MLISNTTDLLIHISCMMTTRSLLQ